MELLKAVERLREILGPSRVFTDEAILVENASDMTEADPHRPDVVVRPAGGEEVAAIVRLADELEVPIIPKVAGTNLGGLTIPVRGGIVMDLREMNRILEVNETDMYAVLEPGVTFGQLKEHLDADYPGLRFGYPLAPPETSVVCNCLLDGLGNLSNAHGAMGSWINGLEAVLPSGETMRTGSAAVSPFWFSRAPLPDLTGLFVSWQGATGIVTKMGVQLYPKRPFRKRMFFLTYDYENSFEAMRAFARKEIFDDIGGLTWPTGKMLFGVEKPLVKDPSEPLFFVYLDISANTKKELKAKKEIMGGVIKGFRKRGVAVDDPLEIEDLVKLNPEFGSLADFPTRLWFLLDHPGGGLTWVGTYGPCSKWESATERGADIMSASGFPPIIVARPMKGGHFCVLRFILVFDKAKPEDLPRVREVLDRLANLSMDEGFVPYKAPGWVVKKFMDRMDPVTYRMMKSIKDLIDPKGIMNPGRWLF